MVGTDFLWALRLALPGCHQQPMATGILESRRADHFGGCRSLCGSILCGSLPAIMGEEAVFFKSGTQTFTVDETRTAQQVVRTIGNVRLCSRLFNLGFCRTDF